MGTVLVGGILILIVAFIVSRMVKAKKQGKSLQCGCDCSHCSGCH